MLCQHHRESYLYTSTQFHNNKLLTLQHYSKEFPPSNNCHCNSRSFPHHQIQQCNNRCCLSRLSPITAVAPTKLVQLFKQFVHQAAYSQIVPSTRLVPALLSPVSMDSPANEPQAATQACFNRA